MFPFFLYSRYERVSTKIPRIRLKSKRPVLKIPAYHNDRHYIDQPRTLPGPLRELINLSSNGDLNLNTSLDVDDDLLDGLGGGEQAKSESLVNYSAPSDSNLQSRIMAALTR